MIPFLWRTATTGVTLWLTTLLIPGSLKFDWGTATATWQKVGIVAIVAVIFGVVNAFIKPFVQVLSIPFYILTLGLFGIIINAFMLWIVSWFTQKVTHWGLVVNNFWWSAIWAAIIVAIVGMVVSAVADAVAK
ncbi:phage holin family protein [Gordonia sp. X0973]|uniref:phage holin family protein n=1 Tax=Gordonia sp. X0973 TaxID=2742602 RepID=UPI000F5308A8|nr:phage holin family protein [Gordonia sp. X0973]QKT08161.1 phage holin family protein [Gordonia sp. X0973]